MRRYAQYHVAPQAYVSGEPLFDGFVVVWLNSLEDISAMATALDRETVAANARNSIRPEPQPYLLTRERVVISR